MSRGGAPSQRKDPRILRNGPDLTILAPPAILRPQRSQALPTGPDISDKDVIAMQAAQIRELEGEVENQKMAAHSIAVTACCLIKAIVDQTGVGVSDEGAIEIPRELYERTRGAEIEIQGWQKGIIGPVYARVVPKSNAPAIGGTRG
jgi:hypothetical protein